MQRLTDDRGAVSVITALLMVPLIAFAAISVDVAAAYSERQQLQSGADAAALAVAQDCARDDCRVPAETAQGLAVTNINDGEAVATVTDPALSPATGRVTVRNAGTTTHWFAPLIGFDETAVVTTATAAWGYPSGGTTLPLTFSWCEWAAQTGGVPSGSTEHTILFTKTSGTGCTGPSGNVVPGGFGWLPVDPSTACRATSAIAGVMQSSTGNAVPSRCSPEAFEALRDATVLLPIFDHSGGTGNNAWYRVHGYAAFRITGYYFAGSYRWEDPCSGQQRCVRGYFTRFVTLSDAFTYDLTAPRLGASVVALTR